METSPKHLLLGSIAVFGNVCLWLFFIQHSSAALSAEPAAYGAEASQPEPLTFQIDVEPKSLSPYSIKYFIEENRYASLKSVWRRLGIPNHPSDQFFDEALGDCGKCEAEVYEYDLDGEPGKEALLRVEAPTVGCCRYLIFKEVE